MHQQEFRVGPALVLLADPVFHGHLHLIEEHLVHFARAIEHDDRLHGNARRLHVDEQEGDAFLRLHARIGAHQAENPVGELRERGPRLLAVDDVRVALAKRAGFEIGEIGTGARLGITLAPPVFA